MTPTITIDGDLARLLLRYRRARVAARDAMRRCEREGTEEAERAERAARAEMDEAAAWLALALDNRAQMEAA